ncbi:asparaginase domain-containing protein [Dactylosporangium sp. NBC_01737]|uniref:asparaginase n=1 Tax=Dactylosporangium sp. NBC_01737 TaxID=2975959 RepID=UPI002E15D0A3|nr:asparaginase domain-containing protein [Dactylosporangium sp. NBC_01737]
MTTLAPPATRVERVGLILTGGTVGSRLTTRVDETVVSLATVAPDEDEPAGLGLVRSAVPDGRIIEFATVSPLALASEDMRPDDWRSIAAAVRAHVDAGLRRVVILHGTDTMCFTAAALSFMLSDLDVTVVITGSNLPPDQEHSDARKNIHDALLAVLELPRGAYVVFAGGADLPGLVHLGTQVRKVRTSGQSFRSVNRRPVASVSGGSLTWIDRWRPGSPSAGVPGGSLCDPDHGVLSFRLYPGLDFDAMHHALRAGGSRAVVIELYAAVTGPNVALSDFIRKCRADGVNVFLTASAPATKGANIYDSFVALREAGGLYLPGMIPETAIVKCMWALGRTKDPESVAEIMSTSVAGEVTV